MEHKPISMAEAVKAYRQMSEEYTEYLKKYSKNISDGSDTRNHFSSPNYSECSTEERAVFDRSVLAGLTVLVIDAIYMKEGTQRPWSYIYKLLNDPVYANTEKNKRKVVYATDWEKRPIGQVGYMMWNGLQIIDIDIKDRDMAVKLKPLIFNNLCKYGWFLGVCLSASGKSLHIWTKITPLAVTQENRKIEYLCNFRHKYSFIYLTLLSLKDKLGYTKDNIFEWMDMAMARPQQGVFISSDNIAMMNTGFKDERLDVYFEQAYDNGVESVEWLSHPDLKRMFAKLTWFADDSYDKDRDIKQDNIESAPDRDPMKGGSSKHYKHVSRWQLANTLTAIYGPAKALIYLSEICGGTPVKELRADIKTASTHSKPISIWAVQELNKYHGFNIKVKTDGELENISDMISNASPEEDPLRIFKDHTGIIHMKLKGHEYLSDIKDKIIKSLDPKLTLLEAGAGYGKTEMVKQLGSNGSKVLLVLPFTSTIKSKIESSEDTKDWLYFYGSKRPGPEDLLSTKSMTMTIDKFSQLNMFELNAAGFDYIVIDESHLLFSSSYRNVMSPALQRVVNTSAKVIFMTGTPTGELLFFPNITHIKVTREETRIKDFTLNMVPGQDELMVEMCRDIASDIMTGRKVLFPTNKGNLYYNKISALVDKFLDEAGWNRPFRHFYYKKSNYGDKSMDDINVNKTFGDNDLICCTTYLSVGVDITDKYKFSIYFSNLFIPQDIEQFANRLRNNDLHIKMYLPKEDAEGNIINYYKTLPLDLTVPKSELLTTRDIITASNNIIERNGNEAKYNPIVQTLSANKQYIKYDEDQCRYYMDETAYKLIVFEDRYKEYSTQLKVFLEGIKYYGYDISIINSDKRLPEGKSADINMFLDECARSYKDARVEETFKLLNSINDNNIEIYKELLRGSYDIFKSPGYEQYRKDNNLYSGSIEVMERNLPVIISLYKEFDIKSIIEIYKYCTGKNGDINYSKLSRVRDFINIERAAKNKRLDFPVTRYIYDIKQWVGPGIIATNKEKNEWLVNYAVKYANSIKDIVVEDVNFLKNIHDIICKMFKTVTVESSSGKRGSREIKMFEPLWDRKYNIKDIYMDETSEFFLDDIADTMNSGDRTLTGAKQEQAPAELTPEKKLHVTDIDKVLSDMITAEYAYKQYMDKDNANGRFIDKQNREYLVLQNTQRQNLLKQAEK